MPNRRFSLLSTGFLEIEMPNRRFSLLSTGFNCWLFITARLSMENSYFLWGFSAPERNPHLRDFSAQERNPLSDPPHGTSFPLMSFLFHRYLWALHKQALYPYPYSILHCCYIVRPFIFSFRLI